MSAHFRLQFATAELERAEKQENACWLAYIEASINERLDYTAFVDAALALAEAAHLRTICHQQFIEAQIASQFEELRHVS